MLWNEIAGCRRVPPLGRAAGPTLGRLPGLVLLALLWAVLSALPAGAATSTAALEKMLVTEQKKAAERNASLQRLTDEERSLNADLALAETRILELESGIATHQDALTELAASDSEAHREYEALLAEQKRTETAQTEVLRLIWDIQCKRISVGGREMADWAIVDREYRWSQGLYLSLDEYRKQLDDQEIRLAEVLGRREKLSGEMKGRLAAINREKNSLLQARIAYGKRLTALRRQKESTEEELTRLMKLVDSLNLQLEERAGAIERQKGKLPWPVQGTVKKHFALAGTNPCRGLAIAARQGAPVQSIAAGTVVHNDVLRGFGTVLIMQHGDEYYSLYAFLGESPLRVGDAVTARQVIGKAGFYPDLEGPGMYFELRFHQKAINPEQWLSAS